MRRLLILGKTYLTTYDRLDRRMPISGLDKFRDSIKKTVANYCKPGYARTLGHFEK